MATSILKVDAIQHTSQSTPNIMLDANGSVTFANTFVANSYSIISATANANIKLGSTDTTNWNLENDLSTGNLVISRNTTGVRKEGLRIDANGAVSFANNVTFAGTSTFNNLSTTGNTTIGDASGDGLTINAGTTTFAGTGSRITGDFSNATVANRVMFQTSTANGQTVVEAIPNGTGTNAAWVASNSSSDPANASLGSCLISATDFRIQSLIRGTGTYLPMTFYTGGSERVRIDTSGNVGIGTASPAATLSIAKQQPALSGTGNSYGVYIYPTSSGLAYFDVITGSTSSTDLALRTYNNGTYNSLISSASAGATTIFQTGGTERMRIDSSGNLGLGVTPSGWGSGYKAFELPTGVAIFAPASGSSQSLMTCNAFLDSVGWKYKGSYAATLHQAIDGAFKWYNAPSGTAGNAITFTQAMTLDASGNLLVGTTSAINDGRFSLNFTGSNGAVLQTDSSAIQYQIQFYISGTRVGTISTVGSATSYNTSSDQRLKTNITPAGSAIQSILDFPVDQFDWISSGEHQDFGGVAQKIIPIIPEMVSVPEDPEEMMGVDWSKAVPRLIKAFQELHAEIEQLKMRIN